MAAKKIEVLVDGKVELLDEDEMIPLQGRIKQLQDGSLTPTQMTSILKFMAASQSRAERREFAAAFETSCKLAKAEKSLETASGSAWVDIENSTRKLEAKITPPKKQKAILDREPIVKKSLAYIRQHGAPKNIHEFTEWLRREGALKRRNRQGIETEASESTVRAILHDVFGIFGEPGRKSRK